MKLMVWFARWTIHATTDDSEEEDKKSYRSEWQQRNGDHDGTSACLSVLYIPSLSESGEETPTTINHPS